MNRAKDIADRAAGRLQGAADAAQGVMHRVRAGHSEREPDGRPEAARTRWEAGLPARNTFERDTFAVLENQVRAGMNRLIAQGKQASAMEAAMASRADREAGS